MLFHGKLFWLCLPVPSKQSVVHVKSELFLAPSFFDVLCLNALYSDDLLSVTSKFLVTVLSSSYELL
jgi:hypothetical protein